MRNLPITWRCTIFICRQEALAWTDFTSYAQVVEDSGIGIHVAPLVGHAPLRLAAMGMDNRPPTAEEMARMQALLTEALRQGAWGMSTGLIYPPGSYAELDELIALAGTLAEHQGIYSSHIRNEGQGLVAALDEAIMIGAKTGVRVQVSHLKAMGNSNRGRGREILGKIAAAQAAGIDVAADQYPYAASATTLAAVVPQWAHAGGVALLLQRLQAPELRAQLSTEIEAAIAAREGAAGIMISNCRSLRNRSFSGKTLQEIGAAWGCTGAETVIRLLIEEGGESAPFSFPWRKKMWQR